MDVFWSSAFLDLAPRDVGIGACYWARVTGYDSAAVWDLAREFPPLAPRDGDAYLWVQRVLDPPSGVHLDLHVPDLDAASEHATAVGGSIVDRRDHAVVRSPGGFAFCLVGDPARRSPGPARWPAGHTSRVDYLCLDVPAAVFDTEAGFWADLTGWTLEPTRHPELCEVVAPHPQPLHLVLQRLGGDDARTRVGAHLDLSTEDRPSETARHEALGGTVVAERPHWTVMRDPVGLPYCITDGA